VRGSEDWRGGLVPYVSILCVTTCDIVCCVRNCVYIVRERERGREREIVCVKGVCACATLFSLSRNEREKVKNGNVAA
jgi:hypothetical protein